MATQALRPGLTYAAPTALGHRGGMATQALRPGLTYAAPTALGHRGSMATQALRPGLTYAAPTALGRRGGNGNPGLAAWANLWRAYGAWSLRGHPHYLRIIYAQSTHNLRNVNRA